MRPGSLLQLGGFQEEWLHGGRVHWQCGQFIGRYNIITQVDLCFLQMFLWESFSALAPKSMEYPKAVMEEAMCQDDSKKMR